MVRLGDMPINEETRRLVAIFVDTLILKYPGQADTAGREVALIGARIDPGSKDITKKIGVPGTYKCKGPHSEERLRRRVTIHRTDKALQPLDLEAWLRENAQKVPAIIQTHPTHFHLAPGQTTLPRRPTRTRGQGMSELEEAQLWLQNRAPAISGQGGRPHTFSTICTVLKGWDLSQGETLALVEGWNLTCQPPWTRKELIEKIQAVDQAPDLKPRGYMRGCRRAPRKQKSRSSVIMPVVDFGP
jgi:hypothetical protein